MNRYFSDGMEFSLIERLFDASHFCSGAEGLGDDGFLMRAGGEVFAVTTDASCSGIHFKLEWVSPAKALRKAVLANLSDLNAMGATARHGLMVLGAPHSWHREEIEALREEIALLEKEFGFRFRGGDTLRLGEGCTFTFTFIGTVAGRPLLRSQARPGHAVYVSGRLGASAAGLHLLRRGGAAADAGESSLVESHHLPRPPLMLGPALARHRSEVAAIDISDGLSSELWHLSRQSRARLVVEEERLPEDPRLAGCFPLQRRRDFVLNGGEDYQLLFTGAFAEEEIDALAPLAEITRIGWVEEGEGVALRRDGMDTALPPGGYSH